MLSVNIVGEEIQIIVILRYVYRLVSACPTYPCAALYQANQLPEKVFALSVSVNQRYFFRFSIQFYVAAVFFRLGTRTIWSGCGKDCVFYLTYLVQTRLSQCLIKK